MKTHVPSTQNNYIDEITAKLMSIYNELYPNGAASIELKYCYCGYTTKNTTNLRKHFLKHFYESDFNIVCIKCSNKFKWYDVNGTICKSHLILHNQFYICSVDDKLIVSNAADSVVNTTPIFQLGLITIDNSWLQRFSTNEEYYHLTFICAPDMQEFNKHFSDAFFNCLTNEDITINGEPQFKKKIKENQMSISSDKTLLIDIFVSGINEMDNLQIYLNTICRIGCVSKEMKLKFVNCTEYLKNQLSKKFLPTTFKNNIDKFFEN